MPRKTVPVPLSAPPGLPAPGAPPLAHLGLAATPVSAAAVAPRASRTPAALSPAGRRLRATLWTALCATALTACATTQAPPDSGLNGHWRLDAAASDNVATLVAGAVTRAQARLRKRHGFFGGRGAGGTGGGDEDFDTSGDVLGNGGTIGPDFQQLRERLTEALGTSTTLVVNVQPDAVDIQRDNLPARDYQPGESITRYDEYGTANLSSRWSGKAFELRQRYTSGARLEERYEIDPSGALLDLRTLQDPTVGKLQVKSVYRRG